MLQFTDEPVEVSEGVAQQGESTPGLMAAAQCGDCGLP